MIAVVIPVAVKSNVPENIPIIPSEFALSSAPCIRECPKLIIGSCAPPPTWIIIQSYISNISKKAPITTNKDVICPGVSFVLSKIICDIKHIKPQNKNELISNI